MKTNFRKNLDKEIKEARKLKDATFGQLICECGKRVWNSQYVWIAGFWILLAYTVWSKLSA